MKAACYDERGNAQDVLMLRNMPKPVPGHGEVLVRLHATGVNPSDTKARAGRRSRNAAFKTVIPHQDGAGIIEAVGKAVDPGRVGERVWLYEAQLGRPFGCAAQYTSVPSANAVPLPDNTSYEEGACLGVPAITAHYCVSADGPVRDKVILVTGGAGAVGFYAIQFAKLEGAKVISTVRTQEQARIAEIAGADLIVFRETDDICSRIAEFTGEQDGRGVDRIIEVALGANLATSARVLKRNGVIAAYASDRDPAPALPFHDLLALNATIRCVLVYSTTRRDHAKAVDAITRALKENKLKHNIGRRFTLDQIIDAHLAVEAGTAGGKAVITIE